MRARFVLVICLLASLLITTQVQAQTTQAARFVTGVCHFKAGKGYTVGKNLTCGMLIVPENPAIATGRQIKLAVAIFQTPSSNRQTDPIVFLQGGPGGGIVQDLGSQVTKKDAPVLMGNHDLILIDQRGTGLSKPALNCPEYDATVARATAETESVTKQTAIEDKALLACRTRLTAKGIDLSQYNTINDAADIADLRIALGLPAMDLYGVSYGTRVAQAVMRYYPAGIRSVVLDSILTPQYDLFSDPLSAEARAFNQLFTGCAQAPKCHKNHPHVKQTFDRLLTYLNKHPLTIKSKVSGSKQTFSVRLDGEWFAEFIRSSMYVTPLIPHLPAIIAEAARGLPLGVGSAFNQATAASSVATGTYESVICAEDAQTATPQAIQAAAVDLPKAIRADTITEQLGRLDACKIWNVAPATPTLNPPVMSDIPTLLLEGQYDPITPPANLTVMESLLTHNYGYVFPYSGHGVYATSACSQIVINTFFDHPTTGPDATCVNGLAGPFS